MEETWDRLNYYTYNCQLEEAEFLYLSDSLTQVCFNLLDSANISEKTFHYIEYNSIKLNTYMYRLNIYPGTYRMLTKNNKYKPSSAFPNVFKDFDINDSELIVASGYLRTITDYLYLTRDTAEFQK